MGGKLFRIIASSVVAPSLEKSGRKKPGIVGMFPWRKGNSPTREGFCEERKEREGSFLIIKNIIGIIKYTIIIFLIFYIVVDRFATLLIFSNLLSTFERSFPLIIILSSPESEMDRIKSDPRTAAFRPTSRSSSITQKALEIYEPLTCPLPRSTNSRGR